MDEENNNGQDNPLGKDSITHLIELMEANNKSSHEIERDGRNSRRHLFDMKKTQMVLADMQAKTVYGFENFQEMLDAQSLQGLEDEKESKTVFQEMRDHLKDIKDNTDGGKKGGDSDGGGGGFMSGFMGGAGNMLGTVAGIGALGAAIPLFFGGILAGESLIEGSVKDMGNIDFGTTKKLLKEFNGVIEVMSPGTMVTLAAILGAATFSKKPLDTAIGMGAMGAAITAFFGGLLIGEGILDGISALGGGVNFNSYTDLINGFDNAISALKPASATALIGLLGAGGLIGYVSDDFKGVLKVATGMGAMGAGIGGFFAGLGAGSSVGAMMTSGFEALPGMVGAFADSVNVLQEKDAAGALVAILGVSAGLGAFLKGGKQALMVTGMTAMGAGIAGFFLGFETLSGLASVLGADGSSSKRLITNFAEGINAFDDKSLAALGALLAVGGIAGPKGGVWLAAGLTAMGLGLAGFFMAFETVAGIGGILGANGSSTKTLLGNFADGINELTRIPLTGKEIQDLGLGLGAIGIGMTAMLGAKGLGGIADTAAEVFNFITGGFFEGKDKNKSVFKVLTESLGPLDKLNVASVQNAAKVFDSLGLFLYGVGQKDMKLKVRETSEAVAELGATLEDTFVTGFDDGKGNKTPLNELVEQMDSATESMRAFKEAAIMDAVGANVSLGFDKDLLIPSMRVTNLSIENAMLKLPEGATGGNNFVSAPQNTINNNQSVIVATGTDRINHSIGHVNTNT